MYRLKCSLYIKNISMTLQNKLQAPKNSKFPHHNSFISETRNNNNYWISENISVSLSTADCSFKCLLKPDLLSPQSELAADGCLITVRYSPTCIHPLIIQHITLIIYSSLFPRLQEASAGARAVIGSERWVGNRAVTGSKQVVHFHK